MTDLFKEKAARLEGINAEARLKWVTTLAVGNGAALFAAFSLGLKDGDLLFPAATLISAWLFLVGVGAASFAHLCEAALMHHMEMYWRWSSTEKVYEGLNDVDELASVRADLKKADEQGDHAEIGVAWASGISSLAFVLGVAVPLVMLTARHLS
ncbi:hypothetical protein [Brevundimonas sp. Root1279]|uniref:hypothetical protein n=1 Tax=Brevundimonas sp. Root1279 TaxID=1736443 RepID=UPI0012E3C451|nr:hypothetical protein [Brevundimonas sp. Root1279]